MLFFLGIDCKNDAHHIFSPASKYLETTENILNIMLFSEDI